MTSALPLITKGFYDGKFFWGAYSSGYWKAEGLFGLNAAYGRYFTCPIPIVATATVQR
jgi:hypothetical protein